VNAAQKIKALKVQAFDISCRTAYYSASARSFLSPQRIFAMTTARGRQSIVSSTFLMIQSDHQPASARLLAAGLLHQTSSINLAPNTSAIGPT